MPRRTPDRTARRAALALATARVGLGLGALGLTDLALQALMFRDASPSARALAKLAGGRDLALGLLTLAAADDAAELRRLVLAGTVLDLADAAALGLAAREPESRAAGVGGVVSGGAAALVGAWAWRRMG